VIIPPRQRSQRLYLDKVLPQTSTQNQPTLLHPSTQTLSTITEGLEHSTFGGIPKVQLHQLANMSTTATGSSQNGGGVGSTQTNRGAPHQSPPRAPLLIQVNQGDVKLDQVQVQGWDEEYYEDEATTEEELIRV
jgi:hypothetical protein